MAHIEAFRGLRYDLGHVGCLGDVVAPPYDVIDAEHQTDLYKRHPANVVRLILNRQEPGDDDGNNRYSRASRYFRNWQREGVLQRDPDPAIYVYHQVFAYGDQEYTRRGFMARVRLERFGEGTIYPHEETHAAAKQDRLHLMTACRANMSQVFGLYPDDDNKCQSILGPPVSDVIPFEATDHLGVVHRLWPVTDVRTITDLSAAMADRPVYIADGHHRYETSCTYRDQVAEGESLPKEHPAQFTLMMCVGMSDPGMIVLPTHRLFRGLPSLTAGELSEKISGHFDLQAAGEGPSAAFDLWKVIEDEGSQATIGLYTRADQRWTLARLNTVGEQRMAEVAPEHSARWQKLGVSILHRLLVKTLLEADDLPKPEYVHLVDEVVDGLGDDNEESFPLSALVMPATLEDIRQISQYGERMPAKSTYFYPKLLSGLVFNPLE